VRLFELRVTALEHTLALIPAVCFCALGVRSLLISVFRCFGPFCGRGRPQDLVERVGFEISCRNQGSLPSGIGSEAIFGVGDRPGGPPCAIRKNGFCAPQRSLKSTLTRFLFFGEGSLRILGFGGPSRSNPSSGLLKSTLPGPGEGPSILNAHLVVVTAAAETLLSHDTR
jgi:hypothetical protein